MPKVSVVQTCYNHEPYIAQALESVLGQTYQDIEIIVINDGSTDRTGEIVARYVEQYPDKIRYVEQPNQGIKLAALSTNRALSLATGEYIAFNDGDDFWYPGKLGKQVKILDNDSEERIGLVYTYGEQLNQDPTRKRRGVYTEGVRGQVFKRLFMGAFLLKISMVIPRHVFDKVDMLFNPKYMFCADYEFMLRIAAAGYGFDYVPESLVAHRIHPGNMTRFQQESNENHRQMILDVASRYKDLIQLYDIDVNRRLALLDGELAWYYFVKGDLSKAREILTSIIRKYPSLVLGRKRYLAYLFLSFLPEPLVLPLKKIGPLRDLFRGK